MKKINIIKYVLDLVMGLTFVLLFDTHASGMTVHEIAGLFMGGAYFTHIALNWRWVKNVSIQMFNRKLKMKVRLGYVLNVLLLIFMTVTVASGILISRVVLPQFNMEEINWFRVAHLTLPFVLLILIGMHIGLHWSWVINMTKRLLHVQKSRLWGRWVARILVLLFLVYGSYAAYAYQFVNRVAASVTVIGISYDMGELRGELMGKHDELGTDNEQSLHNPTAQGEHGKKAGEENGINGREEEGKSGGKGQSEGGVLKAISLFFGLLSVFVIFTYYVDKWLTRPKRSEKPSKVGGAGSSH